MKEKDMVNDALNNLNSALTSYASAISQTENTNLRQTLIQMRNDAEKSQYELYQIAKNLNYYVPAQQASNEEIMKVKSEVTGCGATESKASSIYSEKKCNYISSQSNGILDHMDTHTHQALTAPPKTESTVIPK